MRARVRLGFAALLGAWGLWLALHPGTWTLLDDVNLPIHETGHLVFAPFGEVLTVAGGTIFQLLFPLAFAAYFWRRGDRYAAMVPAWWSGQNCFNVARYVSDARAQELPLVGGGEHDWFTLLDRWDLLGKDVAIGHAVHLLGAVTCVVTAILMARWAGDPPPEG